MRTGTAGAPSGESMSASDDTGRPSRPAIPPFARPAQTPRGPLRPQPPAGVPPFVRPAPSDGRPAEPSSGPAAPPIATTRQSAITPLRPDRVVRPPTPPAAPVTAEPEEVPESSSLGSRPGDRPEVAVRELEADAGDARALQEELPAQPVAASLAMNTDAEDEQDAGRAPAAPTGSEPPAEAESDDGATRIPEIAVLSFEARPGDGATRIPEIPDLSLCVAAALESVAARIRSGELPIPSVRQPVGDDAAVALALGALLGVRS